MSFAAIGYVFDPLANAGASAMCVGALATFPGYLLGVKRQRAEEPQTCGPP
jgi:hypothetical protein